MVSVKPKKRLNKKIGIVGFPIDLGADRRGVDMGPSALRYAHLEEKLEKMGYKVRDFGDLYIEGAETQTIRNPKLKFLPEILRASKLLARKVETLLNGNYFPLIIGGDHDLFLHVGAFYHFYPPCGCLDNYPENFHLAQVFASLFH